ncbi:hypothetical protein OW763_11745 [Clostridium aestuarii]|uniref:Uncharacterized protein n=1 Tax=Clostridium aestuarii TaxID=338193 RepID=A0ABT4D2Y6_9CLOT|nr:hypothetical protein [Clostridium aestuarii]MCY6485017.1 hypothetical protein [Clostridium aestuarii]
MVQINNSKNKLNNLEDYLCKNGYTLENFYNNINTDVLGTRTPHSSISAINTGLLNENEIDEKEPK